VANNLTRSGPWSNFAVAGRPPGMADFMGDFPLAADVPDLEQAPRMPVDIVETDQGYRLTADVPGADREHIEVIVDRNTVTIRAKVEREHAVANRGVLAVERIHGERVRSFVLPHEIDESRAEAKVADGVLVLQLPAKTGRRVEVRHGAEGKLARAPAALPAGIATGSTAATVNLKINGSGYPLQLEARVTLLDALREYAHLYGTKKGCDQGQCGACTVHVNGRRVLSCLTLAMQAEGQEVVTIEGLAADGRLHAMQAAFIRHDALQCGYCTPGQIMSAIACIAEGHAGSDASIREYMSGNLCRCGTYTNIVAAVREMAAATASNQGQTP
jgi:xanthine dehydrogenase YagT iron-sulfur-binding subunit